jgi:hypothetical protein
MTTPSEDKSPMDDFSIVFDKLKDLESLTVFKVTEEIANQARAIQLLDEVTREQDSSFVGAYYSG